MIHLDAVVVWRTISVLVLGWLAFLFGSTLRGGRTPLIERIARVSDPDLPDSLRRYTRRLTALWAAYFIVAATCVLAGLMPAAQIGAWVWAGTAVLFVGEHRLRRRLFPDREFPGLIQQVRDTWAVWHPRNRVRS